MSVSLLSRAEKDKGYELKKNPEKKNVRITQTHRHTDAHTESHTHTQAVKKHRQRHTDTIATSVTPTQNPPPPQKKKTFRPLHLELLKALQNGGVTKSSKTCHK